MNKNKSNQQNNNISQRTLINPYELLGIDIKNKNLKLKDIKKAYFNMALICHPDKGGNDNDMNIVQQSYDFVKEQMKHNSQMTEEKIVDIENDFKKYLDEQEKKVPDFPDIYHDVRQWQQKFNQKFEEERNNSENYMDNSYSYCSPVSGYGNQMEQSEYILNVASDTNSVVLDYNKLKEQYSSYKTKTKSKPIKQEIDNDFFKRGIPNTEYNPQIDSLNKSNFSMFGKEIILNDPNNEPLPHMNTLVGYTNSHEIIASDNSIFCSQGGFSMTDYKEAHQEPCLFDLTKIKEKTTPLEKLLEMRMNNRDEMDKVNLQLLKSDVEIQLGNTTLQNLEENNKKKKTIKNVKNVKNIAKEKEEVKSYIISNVPSDINIKIADMNSPDDIDISEFVIVDKSNIIKGVKNC